MTTWIQTSSRAHYRGEPGCPASAQIIKDWGKWRDGAECSGKVNRESPAVFSGQEPRKLEKSSPDTRGKEQKKEE